MELRNFLIASASTFGLLEVTNSEAYLPVESDPESLVIKALITLLVGGLSSVVTRVIRHNKKKGHRPRQRSKRAGRSSQTPKNN